MEQSRKHWFVRVGKHLVTALALVAGGLIPAWSAPVADASVVRGGRLYNHWAHEIGTRLPVRANPAFTAKGTTVSTGDSWRCSTCHGFDYKGRLGTVGVVARRGSEASAIVAVLKNATHGYDKYLRDSDLLDLAAFVSQGQVDVAGAIDAARRTATPVAGTARYFGTICAGCHGLDGTRQRELLPLGDLARAEPSEVLHAVLNGHPGGEMPALAVLGSQFAGQMVLYVQTLPTLNLSASIAHGGRLYDDWQSETGARKPILPHPSYPAAGFYANDPQASWRCKSCHGWDYLGNQGEASRGRYATGIKGIKGMVGADVQRIAAILRDDTHKYGAVLKQRDVLDLANFVSAGQVDMGSVIDGASHRLRGDAVSGGPFYRTLCVACHDTDGKGMSSSLARAVSANPYGAVHTVLNGHPDERMPALRELQLQTVIDILSYVQTLPIR